MSGARILRRLQWATSGCWWHSTLAFQTVSTSGHKRIHPVSSVLVLKQVTSFDPAISGNYKSESLEETLQSIKLTVESTSGHGLHGNCHDCHGFALPGTDQVQVNAAASGSTQLGQRDSLPCGSLETSLSHWKLRETPLADFIGQERVQPVGIC